MEISKIVIHAADTPADMDIGAAEIRRWHSDPKPVGNGWADIGYHYVIRRDGKSEKGRPDDKMGAHVRGHNQGTLGICLVGGMPGCNFTSAQWSTLYVLVLHLLRRHGLGADAVHGHRDLDGRKTCPTFDARAWASTLEVGP